jgi:hypothetical protein
VLQTERTIVPVPRDWSRKEVVARGGGIVATAGLCLVLAGCGHQARLSTTQVVAAAHAAGFPRLRMLTYGEGIGSIPAALPRTIGASKAGLRRRANGADFVIPTSARYLWLVRMPSIATAVRSMRGGNYERGNGFVIRARRVCNVVLIDWAPGLARAERAATRIIAELRRRCG